MTQGELIEFYLCLLLIWEVKLTATVHPRAFGASCRDSMPALSPEKAESIFYFGGRDGQAPSGHEFLNVSSHEKDKAEKVLLSPLPLFQISVHIYAPHI